MKAQSAHFQQQATSVVEIHNCISSLQYLPVVAEVVDGSTLARGVNGGILVDHFIHLHGVEEGRGKRLD